MSVSARVPSDDINANKFNSIRVPEGGVPRTHLSSTGKYDLKTGIVMDARSPEISRISAIFYTYRLALNNILNESGYIHDNNWFVRLLFLYEHNSFLNHKSQIRNSTVKS